MDRLSRVESSLARLETAVGCIEQRVGLIEHALAASPARVGPVPDGLTPAPAPPVSRPEPVLVVPPPAVESPTPPLDDYPSVATRDLSNIPALVGRTFLALAGAYLLRALSESGSLPQTAGVAIGLGYALMWFVLTDRAAAAGQRASAGFHGLVASMVMFPVVWEATYRFQLFSATQSALALAFLSTAGLAIAARRQLHLVAWVVCSLAVLTAFSLVPTTNHIVPYTIFLIALGVATLWLGYLRDWVALRWPVALAADLAVLGVTVRVASGRGFESAPAAAAVQMLLIAGYLISIIIRTLVRGRDVVPFEVFQGVAALGVGLGGLVAIARAMTAGTEAIGGATLVLGAACYVIAFLFIARRQGLRDNFYFYTSLGVMLVLASTTLLLADTPLAVSRALLALAAASLAARYGPPLLTIHAALYGIFAASTSGLLSTAAYRLFDRGATAWSPFDATMVAVMVASGVCAAIPVSPRARTWGPSSHVPRVALLLLIMWGGAGWLIDRLAGPLAGVAGGTFDPGTLATIRTVVLSVAAFALAWIGTHESFHEASWIVYPLLVAGGLKLLAEDFPRSRPATLFIALAAYGAALILAPRLTRKPQVP